MIINENEIYTSRDLQKMLKISLRKYQRMRADGEIPVPIILPGGREKQHHRYLGSDILEWINQHKESDGQAD